MTVVDKMHEDYQIDAASKKADVLAAIVRQPISDKITSSTIADTALQLCGDAIACDDFDLASRFVNAAAAAGRKSRDSDQNRVILARMKEVDSLKGRVHSRKKGIGHAAKR